MAERARIEHFAVDARLLRELGERLVGRPHIALAELIKNAYDADARLVEITFEPGRIVVADDGHGMSEADFLQRWMRIGTGRKEQLRLSPELRRPMTGSKGVGRLAAQLLARRLRLVTVGLSNQRLKGREARHVARGNQLGPAVDATVEWDAAARLAMKKSDEVDLASVPVRVVIGERDVAFPDGSSCGTWIELSNLSTTWDANRFRRLAEELWALQPPFEVEADGEEAFRIRLHSPFGDVVEEFDQQMRALLEIWSAKVEAKLLPVDSTRRRSRRTFSLNDVPARRDDAPGETLDDMFGNAVPDGTVRTLRVSVNLRDGGSRTVDFEVPNCHISELHYQVRVFSLQNRQPRGIKVDVARDYLNRFGGVHIHDAGFRLPYYGPEQDWLHIEQDHAHRLSASRLLPATLQVQAGLQNLTTNSRLFGSVHISTSTEAHAAEARRAPSDVALAMQVTRDRLVENLGFRQLRTLVRLGVDLYAMEEARRRTPRSRRTREPNETSRALRNLRRVVRATRDSMPEATFLALDEGLSQVADDVEVLEASTKEWLSILGALATAGMTSLAYEHEIQKQFGSLNEVVELLERLADAVRAPADQELGRAAAATRDVLQRGERIRAVFSALLDEETRTRVEEWPARRLVQDVAKSLAVLARGTTVDAAGVPTQLRLPKGPYPAWSAVVQNLLVNSFNAVLDQPRKAIVVDGGTSADRGWLRFQDTGSGVNLSDADRLFEPFERGLPPSRERAALGLGGSGLGLTIVRMIAGEIGVDVRFVAPEPPYASAVRIEWKAVTG